MFNTEAQSYYEILDVKPDATQSEIRQAYFRVKAAYGKDSAALYSLFDEQETQLVLERVEEAYLVLSNLDKRREYDRLHGFLRTDDAALASGEKPAENIFSFAQTAARSANAAHEAAATVLSSSSGLHEEDDLFTEPSPEPMRNARATLSDSFDHAAAREDAIASQTHKDVSAFKENPKDVLRDYDNKLGILKRIDLIRTGGVDTAMESEIETERDFRGPFLKKVRESRAITLDELAEFTKINKPYLMHIEAEEFTKLPAPVYVRGFIQQIAKALKLPHDKVTSGYMDHYKRANVVK